MLSSARCALLAKRSKVSYTPSARNKLIFKACLLGGVFLFFTYIIYSTTHPKLPSSQAPILFYSNQTSSDLKILFKKAIESAKTSLFVQVYGCSDPDLLKELEKATKRNVQVELFYDPSGSGPLSQKFPFAFPLPCKGLMHKKILIVDEEKVFIGSANFTPTSLRMHDNLVVGIYQKELASFLLSSIEHHLIFSIGDQTAEFWHLPDFHHLSLQRALNLIQSAKLSIRLALFTFTHPRILNALVEAKNRGVKIEVALDFYAAQGASKKALQRLKQEGIASLIGPKEKLLHYKWACIDDSTLLLGSANWTESAFRSNEDCFLILQDLNKEQKKYMSRLWKEIARNSGG